MIYVRAWSDTCQECPSYVEQYDSEFDARTKAHALTREDYAFADVVVQDYGSQEARLICVMCIERMDGAKRKK